MRLSRVRFHSILILALAFTLVGCAPSIGLPSVGGTIGRAMDVAELGAGVRDMREIYNMRREPAPLAGTYEITIDIPGHQPATVYGKTYFNKNVPIIETEENTALEKLGYHAARVDHRAGYMTNIVAYPSLEAVPDTLAQDGMVGGGFLVAAGQPDTKPTGEIVTAGHIALRVSPAAAPLGGVAAAYEGLVEDEGVKTRADAFVTGTDGSVTGAVHFVNQDGATVATVKYRRISTAAFGLSEEALETPTPDDILEGYTEVLLNPDQSK